MGNLNKEKLEQFRRGCPSNVLIKPRPYGRGVVFEKVGSKEDVPLYINSKKDCKQWAEMFNKLAECFDE